MLRAFIITTAPVEVKLPEAVCSVQRTPGQDWKQAAQHTLVLVSFRFRFHLWNCILYSLPEQQVKTETSLVDAVCAQFSQWSHSKGYNLLVKYKHVFTRL